MTDGEPAHDEQDAPAWLTEAQLEGPALADPRIAQLLRAALHPVT
jgi:hypothetical protein